MDKFILYSPYADGIFGRLIEVLDRHFLKDQWELYIDPRDLRSGLQQLKGYISTAVLIAHTKYDLEKMISLQPLLDGFSIILILPDGNNDTMTSAHTFHPRYFTYINSDFKEIVRVLKKMLGEDNEFVNKINLFKGC